MSATGEGAAGPPLLSGPKTPGFLLLPLMLVLFLSNLDQSIIAVALPSIEQELGGPPNVSWVATAYLMAGAVATLVSGKLGDIYGRRTVLLVSVAVFLTGSAAAGLATGTAALTGARALQGLGGGGLFSLTMAIVAEAVPARERARSQALLGTMATVALISGPVLGGMCAEYASWRWIFYINLPAGILAIVLTARRLPHQQPEKPGRFDWLGALIMSVFTVSALLITTWGGTAYPWTSAPVLGLLALAAATLGAYVRTERRAVSPLTPLYLFRSRTFTITTIQFALAMLVLMAELLYVPLYLHKAHGLSVFHAGLFIIPLLGGMIAATILCGIIISRTGRYKGPAVTGAAIAVTFLPLTALSVYHESLAALALAELGVGTGVGLSFQSALTAGQNTVSETDLGSATGIMNFFKSLGGALGSALMGTIISNGTAHAHPTPEQTAHAFGIGFAWTIPCALIAFALSFALPDSRLPSTVPSSAGDRGEPSLKPSR